MSQLLNVGIAGFGYSSHVFHVPFLKEDPRFHIAKVYERSTDKALAVLPNVEIVRQFDGLLSDEIDLIIITTPNQTHYELAKQAIWTGKHVLVEKPLVVDVQQAVELNELAKRQNVILSVYQNRRWDSAIATAKQILAQDLLGDPVDCEIRFERYAKGKNVKAWKETGEKGTGLVYDLGVHLIDASLYLFGMPSAVFADIRYQHEGALSDDNFTLHLYYESGLKVALHASKYAREAGKHFVLHGKLGSYVKAKPDIQEGLLASGVIPHKNYNREAEQDWGILHTEIDGEVVRQPFQNTETSYQALYDNLYLTITEHQPLAVTAEQATAVLSIIEKAFESAAKGQKIQLD